MNKRTEVIGWVLLPGSISNRVQPPLLRMHTNPFPHLSQLKRVVMVLVIKRDSSLLKSAIANVAKFILLHIALNGSYCKVWQFILLQSSTAIVTKCVSSSLFPSAKVVIAYTKCYDPSTEEWVSLGDVTAHGRVQDWPSRERLGTRLASPFSPFYIPLLTIDHPLSMICLLVQAFLVCKTARIFKNLQTTFSQKCK